MATPRRPYVMIPLGTVENAIAAGASPSSALLLLRIWTHRDKRSIPGLLRSGPAGLSETLNVPVAQVQRQLGELERVGCILFDRPARLILCVGAIDCDPPRTENAVRGMAKQYRELPPLSHVTRAVGAAIEASLLSGDRECAWMSTWVAMTRPDSGPDSGQSPGPESDPGSSPEPGPLPKAARPRAEDPKAAAADPKALDRYQLAWSRLPKPFAAAAASDLSAAGKRFSVEAFDGLVKALACSKWVTGEGGLKVTPTLRVLLIQRGYADRIIRGEFADVHSRWRCPDCDTDHAPTGDCPPPCRACQRPHAHGFVCTRAMEMEARERTNAERSPDPFVESVAKVGFREAMRQKASA